MSSLTNAVDEQFAFRVDCPHTTLTSSSTVPLQLLPDERMLTINFKPDDDRTIRYAIHLKDMVQYSNQAFVLDDSSNVQDVHLYVRLRRPGRLLQPSRQRIGNTTERDNALASVLEMLLGFNTLGGFSDEEWIRTVDYTAPHPGDEGYFSKFMTLRLTFSHTQKEDVLKGCAALLKCEPDALKRRPVREIRTTPAITTAIHTMLSNGRFSPFPAFPYLNQLPFPLKYRIESLFGRGLLDLAVLCDPTFQSILLDGSISTPQLEDALNSIEYAIAEQARRREQSNSFESNAQAIIASERGEEHLSFEEEYDVDTQMLEPLLPPVAVEMLRQRTERGEGNSGRVTGRIRRFDPTDNSIVLVYHALVTPTRIHVTGPYPEQSNRVLRHYSQYTDHFLRVSFVEENMDKIMVGFSGTYELMLRHRLRKSVLGNGILICGRRYEFLAFSSSQLREHGCWYFAGGGTGLSPDNVRRWMGSFDCIKEVAKNAARMGQCFTSSTSTIAVEGVRIPEIERDGFKFSDGIGQVSQELADEIWRMINDGRPARRGALAPSAYQIRHGGAKGMIAINPDLRGRTLRLRPSMIKFEGQSNILEIVKTSNRVPPAFLNRQAITLLSGVRNIPDEVFIELQEVALRDLNSMLARDALRGIKEYTGGKGVEISGNQGIHVGSDGFPMVEVFTALVSAGVPALRFPILQQMVDSIRLSLLRDLKNKTRIPAPDSFTLLGVLDEVGTLEKDEVFIWLRGEESPRVGNLTVIKFPALHPGDVKVLKAVDRHQLHHLRNVCVFSQLGNRPLVNELSGSDLDGDEYAVFFDTRLIPTNHNHLPMDYTGQTPKNISDGVTIPHILDFFIDYIRNDRLGMICSAWLAKADYEIGGPKHHECKNLAELASVAVDFNKSGVPADLPRELQPTEAPDFMAKANAKGRREVYKSSKVLGELFRSVQIRRAPQTQPLSDTQLQRFLVPGYEECLEFAAALARSYTDELRRSMGLWRVRKEAEFLGGAISMLDGIHRRKAHDIQVAIRGHVGRLVREFRERLY
ncbi:hypothetical protein HDV00_005069 [Rhizophlyctis rosea]|nr:hypothetical protein HDV00_005069 [Rhizophlyctis rosea]